MDKVMMISMLVSVVTSNPESLVVEQQKPQAFVQINKDLPEKLPSFCNGIQCPNFKILNKTEDYELRRYPRTSWTATELKGESYDKSSYTMFMKLFRYIQGSNVEKKKIPMTCPVLNRIIPGPGATCENDFVMAFYDDPKEGKSPDATDKTVYEMPMRPMEVYVRSFGGWARYEQYRQAGVELGNALNKAGLNGTYVTDFYYTAGYDSPYKLFNRHNEIWFIKK